MTSTPKTGSDPSAEWSTLVTATSGRRSQSLPRISPIDQQTHFSSRPQLNVSASENNVLKSHQPDMDQDSELSLMHSNNPYRNGTSARRRMGATKEARFPTETEPSIGNSDPSSSFSDFSNITKATTNDSGISDMSGESYYDEQQQKSFGLAKCAAFTEFVAWWK